LYQSAEGARGVVMREGVHCAEIGTLMGVPASRDLSAGNAAVPVIPFDCGFHPTRIGARPG
jgi:hypothetical protein